MQDQHKKAPVRILSASNSAKRQILRSSETGLRFGLAIAGIFTEQLCRQRTAETILYLLLNRDVYFQSPEARMNGENQCGT
jgi:hypothetical protein